MTTVRVAMAIVTEVARSLHWSWSVGALTVPEVVTLILNLGGSATAVAVAGVAADGWWIAMVSGVCALLLSATARLAYLRVKSSDELLRTTHVILAATDIRESPHDKERVGFCFRPLVTVSSDRERCRFWILPSRASQSDALVCRDSRSQRSLVEYGIPGKIACDEIKACFPPRPLNESQRGGVEIIIECQLALDSDPPQRVRRRRISATIRIEYTLCYPQNAPDGFDFTSEVLHRDDTLIW